MKAQFVSEDVNFQRGQDPRDGMKIGIPKAAAERQLKTFADIMGWEFYKTPRGIWTLTTPLDLEVEHSMESSGGYNGSYEYGNFNADSLRYKVSWQEGSWGTLISLRKVYMEDGKEIKQNKLGDFENIGLVIKRIELNYPKELKKAGIVSESIEFNFKEPPYKKYQSTQGISRPPTENPRKLKQGLTDEEQAIIDRHEKTISELEGEIEIKEDEITEINYQIDQLTGEDIDQEEAEQFDADIIERFGWKALDLLNSGILDNEKIKALDKMNPKNDSGIREYQNIISDYNYYHPSEPDEDQLAGYADEIESIEKDIKILQNRVNKLETKIYNLKTY